MMKPSVSAARRVSHDVKPARASRSPPRNSREPEARMPAVAPPTSSAQPSTRQVPGAARRSSSSVSPAKGPQQQQSAPGVQATSQALPRLVVPVPKSPLGHEVVAVCTYAQTVAASLAHRTRQLPPPPPLPLLFGASPAGGEDESRPPSGRLERRGSVNSLVQLSRASPVEKVQKLGMGLLHWCGLLESAAPLPDGVTLDAVNHNVSTLVRDLNSNVHDCRARCEDATTGGNRHPTQPGAATQGPPRSDDDLTALWRFHSASLDELMASIARIGADARAIISLRSAVLRRDEAETKNLLTALRQGSSTSGGGSGTVHSNAWLRWVEQTWLPAMGEWKGLLAHTKELALSGNPGAVSVALQTAHRSAAERSASLKELLAPGETIDALVHVHVDHELQQLEALLARQRAALDQLRDAVTQIDFVRLAACLRAVDEFASTIQSRADRQLIADAQQLLVDVQQVAKAAVGMNLAVKSQDTQQLVLTVHATNLVMASLKLFTDESKMQTALQLGERAAAASTGASAATPSSPARLDERTASAMSVEHVPSRAWAPEMSLLYQRACATLRECVIRDNLEGQLERALRGCDKVGDGAANNDDGSAEVARSTDAVVSGVGVSANHLNELHKAVSACRSFGLRNAPGLVAAEALLSKSKQIRLKVHFESRVRLVVLQGEEGGMPSFDTVVSKVYQACGLSYARPSGGGNSHGSNGGSGGGLRLRYQDTDGDFISLLDAEDWNNLMRDLISAGALGDGGVGTKVDVYCDYPPQPATPNSSPSGPGYAARARNVGATSTEARLTTPTKGANSAANVDWVAHSGSGNAALFRNPPLVVQGRNPQQPTATAATTGLVAASSGTGTAGQRRDDAVVLGNRGSVAPTRSSGPVVDLRQRPLPPPSSNVGVCVDGEKAPKWEVATAEALELLTIASQDTVYSTRPSVERGYSTATSAGPTVAEGAKICGVSDTTTTTTTVTSPGKWPQRVGDDADIVTIASEDTAADARRTASNRLYAQQQPVTSPRNGASPRPGSAKDSRMSPALMQPTQSPMSTPNLLQLRRQKDAMEAPLRQLHRPPAADQQGEMLRPVVVASASASGALGRRP